MLINKSGQLAEGLYLLGSEQSLMYLVWGKEAMIIGGGMNWIASQLEEQLTAVGIEAEKIKYLVIQHTHFDHCGAVPYLKRKYPQIKVLATNAARKILSKEKVINYIELVNKLIIDSYGLQDQYEKLNLKIDAITIDETVNEATTIDLGNGLDIHFMETPGHSPCAVSVNIPGLKAVFPTDSAPCPLGSIDKLARPSPQHDYILYKQSLRKLLTHDVEICGFDHYAAVTGADARQVLLNGLTVCEEYEKFIVGLYNETGDFEQVARQVARETMEIDNFDFMSEDLMLPIYRAEVRNILKSAGININ